MTAGDQPRDGSQAPSPAVTTTSNTAAPSCREDRTAKQQQLQKSGGKRMTRKVSREDFPTLTTNALKRSPQYVSGAEDEEENDITTERSGSPMRCVSDYDKLASDSKAGSEENDADDSISIKCESNGTKNAPPLPNPLHNSSLRSAHVRALRLEAELQPMRIILSRLMAHPSFNKKGIFNTPVNAAALGLVDYHDVIKKPMDFGTVKAKLYALAYTSRQDVAEDIRLVCQNAMTYNPPGHAVHNAACNLQEFFEDLFAAVGGERKVVTFTPRQPVAVEASTPVSPADFKRSVSFADESIAVTVTSSKSNTDSAPVLDSPSIARAVSCDIEMPDARPNTEKSVSVPTGPASKAAAAAAHKSVPPPSSIQLMKTSDTVAPVSSLSPRALPLQNNSRGTRAKALSKTGASPAETKNIRRRRLSVGSNAPGHNCRSCRGRTCLLCEQGCLPLEPTLLICAGAACAGAKIRKGAMYYIAPDGSRQYCQRCFINIPQILSEGTDEESVRYKRDFLKRKNEEEVVEQWLTCRKCDSGVHQICAMHDSFVHSSDNYICPSCFHQRLSKATDSKAGNTAKEVTKNGVYTFITGFEDPVPILKVADTSFRLGEDILSADTLVETDVSSFIQAKVKQRIAETSGVKNAEKTVTVRIISDCDRQFAVPEVVRKHFRMPTKDESDFNALIAPPKTVSYNSKAIALFQKTDGLDICIFCMYVQEYDGDDEYDLDEGMDAPCPLSKKRVYIAYLDSVEHFRPRSCRTHVYHELLVSYLASARKRGFESAHIWACPPSRGNSFVFWNHPTSQRTPTKELLISWYHRALSRAIECGVVTDVKSLYESDFHENLQGLEKENGDASPAGSSGGKMPCPPLLEGDYWIEEAVRIHAASIARHQKTRSTNEGKDLGEAQVLLSLENGWDPCPARQIGALLIDRVIAHASAAPFRLPVNAAALKLKDYHKIVTKPMDLGTVYSKCVHGEYHCLRGLVSDVQLVFANARAFNPAGHIVHTMAIEMESVFFAELNKLTSTWGDSSKTSDGDGYGWQAFAHVSLSLDNRLPSVKTTASSGATIQRFESKSTAETLPRENPMAIDKKIPSKTDISAAETELLTGGPNAVSQRMIGEDTWLTEKKPNGQFNGAGKKSGNKSGKGSAKRRHASTCLNGSLDEPCQKRRRQTWLGEEVGASVRSLRTSFFTCSLVPKESMSEKEKDMVGAFEDYANCFSAAAASKSKAVKSKIADARHALLEFSQFRNLEFDTVRHAKYSTAVLLYHLHNENAPGTVPICTSCKQETEGRRWHKITKIEEVRKGPSKKKKARVSSTDSDYQSGPEELCSSCYATHPKKDQFIPLHVSFSSS